MSKTATAVQPHWEVDEDSPRFHRPGLSSVMGADDNVSLSSAFKSARWKDYCSPTRLARLLWGVSTNITRQFEIFHLLALPAFTGLALRDPRFPFKYLADGYLARGLTVAERAYCFLHHYRRLHARFPRVLLRRVLRRDLAILEFLEDGTCYDITIGLSRREDIAQDREGELCLKLRVDGVVVFVLAFSIVPGWVVGSKAADVILISRLQGIRGCYPLINQATKALREVAPAALLVAVAQGVAEACGIMEMAGVCATRQVNYTEDLSPFFKKAYDDFFAVLGAARTEANFFLSPIPAEEKSLATVKNGHKARTRNKRAFKLQIAENVCRLIRQSC